MKKICQNEKLQKIEKVLLWIVGIFAMMVFAGEISNPEYWWVQVIAGVILFAIVKITVNFGEVR